MTDQGGVTRPSLPPSTSADAQGIRLTQRDVLPLPLPSLHLLDGERSHGCRQRRCRGAAVPLTLFDVSPL